MLQLKNCSFLFVFTHFCFQNMDKIAGFKMEKLIIIGHFRLISNQFWGLQMDNMETSTYYKKKLRGVILTNFNWNWCNHISKMCLIPSDICSSTPRPSLLPSLSLTFFILLSFFLYTPLSLSSFKNKLTCYSSGFDVAYWLWK